MGTQCIPSTGTNASGEAAPATHTARGSTGSSSRTKSRGIAETRGAMDNEVAETPEAKPGSQAVLMSEVRYGIVFGEMNEVFNTRANSLLVFITSLATALAAGGFVSLLSKALDHETVLLWAIGAAIFGALSAAAKVAFKFKERAEQFRVAKKAFQDLEGRGWSMNQNTLTKELAKLRSNAPSGGGFLASAAFNKACAELGYPERHRDMPAYVEFIAARVS
jgi:hypothetical protein